MLKSNAEIQRLNTCKKKKGISIAEDALFTCAGYIFIPLIKSSNFCVGFQPQMLVYRNKLRFSALSALKFFAFISVIIH